MNALSIRRGAAILADVVIMCAGVVPATGFLRDSGIRLARNGAVTC